MKKLLTINILLFIAFIAFTSCDKEEVEAEQTENLKQTDNLSQTGILGKWALNGRSINSISDLTVKCCEYIAFKADNNPNDLKGEFKSTGTGYETNGVFEVIDTINSIQFAYKNTQKLYEFNLLQNQLSFTYFMKDSSKVLENWTRVE